MDEALTLNTYEMPLTKAKKSEVMDRIKSKLEMAKLNLVYTELEDAGIPFNRGYDSIDSLVGSIKGNLSREELDKVNSIVDKVNESLDTMVNDLEKGSENAFTKLMTSPLSKTIATSLGVTLAGRTAFMLAPTVGTKALVGAGLAGYGLYRLIKNRKEVKDANETNELNNILMDLETTKSGDELVDTRFSKEAQELIRNYLKEHNIDFDDTGYRSLRACIYNLDNEKKRHLCDFLNDKLERYYNIEDRVASAKRKLNVIATTAGAVSAGTTLGLNAAVVVNSIDPALVAGPLNGTVLAAWIDKVADTKWLTALVGGVGAVGTEVLRHIPFLSGVADKVFSIENLVALGSAGAVGGAVVAAGLGVGSIVKNIITNKKNKKETEKFLSIDGTKYAEEDKEELKLLNEKLQEPVNLLESCVVDVVVGSLRDDGVEINNNPRTVAELKTIIEKLPSQDKSKANTLLNTISYNMDNDPNFVKDLKKAGKISIGLFTAGLSALSVYDIVKGGTFLPELSKQLFPNNNMYTTVDTSPITEGFDPETKGDIIEENQKVIDELHGEEYMTTNTSDQLYKMADSNAENNGILGTIQSWGQKGVAWLWDKGEGIFGKSDIAVSDVPAMVDRLNEMTPEELYNFYRTFNTFESDHSEAYMGIQEALRTKSLIEKASGYIEDVKKMQEFNAIINKVNNVASTVAVPIAVGAETVSYVQKDTTNDQFNNDERELDQRIR